MHRELNTHLKVGKPKLFFMRSTDPPSFIQILGDAVIWAPLTVAAGTYFSVLAKHAADATWNRMTSLRKNKETEPLVEVVDTLLNAANSIEGKVEIIFGLNVPDDSFGTVISTTNEHPPEHVLHLLASFVMSDDELSEIVQAEIAAGRAPLGRINVEVCANGDLVAKWRLKTDGSQLEIRIPRTRP